MVNEAEIRLNLQDHSEVWKVIRKITDERNGWFKFYWGTIVSASTALAFLYRYFVQRQEPGGGLSKAPPEFWVLAFTIVTLLIILSAFISMILFGLRKLSVEYRNKLNIIRGQFLNENDLTFDGENPSKTEAFPTRPDQKFCTGGVENWVIIMHILVSSALFVPLSFFALKLCGIPLCLMVVVFMMYLVGSSGLVFYRGHVFDRTNMRRSMRDVYCTYCSKDKDRVRYKLPAIDRYDNDRIRCVGRLAIVQHKGFLILSGKHRLIAPEKKIHYYDYLLEEKKVPRMASKIAKRLSYIGTRELTFFSKDLSRDEKLKPYYDAISLACANAEVKFVHCILS